jgi:hypothetical protein
MTTTTGTTDTFGKWMRAVDVAVMRVIGLSIHDLADQPFRDWYEDGITPTQAARLALEDEGF